MASQVPPLKNNAYSFEVALVSQADQTAFQTSPTLAAGDVRVSLDGGAFANITSLPTEIGATGVLTVALTAAEMNGDRIKVLFVDAAGDEWVDLLVTIHTVTTNQIDDLSTLDSINITNDLIESQRDDHAAVAVSNFWYVDPINGNDGNAGTRDAPFATVTAAHAAASDWNHDIIFLVSGATGQQTILDEQVTISKNYLSIRGPGGDFLWKSTSNGDVITVTGEGIELSSFELQTHTVGSGKGFVVSGDFIQIRHVEVSHTQGNALELNGCSRCLVENVIMHNTGQSGSGDGIVIDGSSLATNRNRVRDCFLIGTQGDGIVLSGANANDNIIQHNTIHGSIGWGINIGAGVSGTAAQDNFFGNNSSGNVNDNGTNSDIERNDDWASSAEIAALNDIAQSDILSDATPFAGANVDAAISSRSDFDETADQVIVATVNDKTGYSLSAAGIQAIWDALTSALTTAGSIGKLIVDKLGLITSSTSLSVAAPLGTAENQDFEMWSGDDKEIVVSVTDTAGADVDLTGATVNWILKDRAGLGAALITKATGSGITVSSNTFTITLDPADTAGLGGHAYYHEAQVTLPSGAVHTVMTGKATINVDGVT